jgi:hypothetical protein
MTEQRFTIFRRDDCRPWTASERVPHVVEANPSQARLAPCLLPTAVAHGPDAPPAIGEHPDRVFTKANAICERVIGTIRRECLDW